MPSLNPPKINKNPSPDREVFFLCSQVPQDRPELPQDVKVEAPSVPNDKFRHQKCQDPFAKMPRIESPRAMSNGQEPAAEGVAHRIPRPPKG